MLDWRVLGAGVVLGDHDQCGSQNQSNGAGAKQFHLAACGCHGVVRHQPLGHKEKGHQRQAARHRQAFVQGRHHVLHARRSLYKKAADDRCNDGHRAQRERVDDRHRAQGRQQQGAQHHGGNQRDGIGFEQISGHASAIAHVVAYVVGNHRRVARVIFGNAGLDLAHQIGTYVSALGKDASAQTGKNRNQRGAKGKTNQRVKQLGQVHVGREVAVAHQEPIKTGDPQQAQAHHQHAGDRPPPKGHVQCRANAFGGRLSRAHIGANRDVHADEATSSGQHRPNHKTHGTEGVQKHGDQNRQHHPHNRNGLVLPRQIGGCPGLNGGRNLLHARVAGVLGKNPTSGPYTVAHGDEAAHERQNKR